MRCQGLEDCFAQIGAYADGEGIGYPLLVNVENFTDYQGIMGRLSADGTKQCIRISEHTRPNGWPDFASVFERISRSGSYAVSGLSQGLMLCGEEVLDRSVDELIGLSIQGHAIVVLDHFRNYLEKFMNRDPRLSRRILLVDGETCPLPQICVAKTKEECTGAYEDGMKSLLAHFERLTDHELAENPVISVVLPSPAMLLRLSVYQIAVSSGVYGALAEKFPELSGASDRNDGTEESWRWLQRQSEKHSSFAAFISDRFGTSSNLWTCLEDTFSSGDAHEKWLLWLSMRVLGAGSNGYLAFVLEHSKEYGDLERHIYQDLLEIATDDERFESFYRERLQLIEDLPENLPEMKSYCDNVGRYGKKAAYYLTDSTTDEEYTFMQLVDQNEWSDEELQTAVGHAFPELALYMGGFVFDRMNTRLPDQDAPFRERLTEYFRRYKLQKIKNHIEPDFLETVKSFAVERPFYKLQPRSAIVKAMDKKGVQAYFFDALGVEYLAYIQAKCEQYGLIYEINIAHCELPSITVKNKEFQQQFDTKDIGALDELKHHSQTYDYQVCAYPIHIFRELEIIDRELRGIRRHLVQGGAQKAVILSDHGASRLAVIYKHENGSMLELEEKGEHSGRCCPCNEDPGIAEAAYEDGYAVLANYERFKGSRKANLEVHGGASLEEVVVPIITLSLRPENVTYCLVDDVVTFKMGQPVQVVLFSNVPMKAPRLEVDGVFYDGTFTTDSKHAAFTLTEQKRTKEYEAVVYEGNTNTGVTLKFRIERKTKARDLFGLG